MHVYAIALGSNRRHGRYGRPERVVQAAVARLADELRLLAQSAIQRTPALGPAGRSFANAAVVVEGGDSPRALLRRLKAIERAFGRRAGRRWGPRVLDLDIVLWSSGHYADRRLSVPHRGLAQRRFVLEPLSEIAPIWRVPRTGATVRQLAARLTRPRPVHRAARTVGP